MSLEEKEEITDFARAEALTDAEEWLDKACELMAKLNISLGADVEPEVGSDQELENVRSCREDDIITLSVVGSEDRVTDEDDIPDLTPATISSNCSDESEDSDYSFICGMAGGKIIDLTKESGVELKLGRPLVGEDDMTVLKDVIDEMGRDGANRWQQDIPEDGPRGADYGPMGWGGLSTPSQPPRSDDKNDRWISESEEEESVGSYLSKEVFDDARRVGVSGWQQDIDRDDDRWISEEEESVGSFGSYVYTLEEVFGYERDVIMISERWSSDEEINYKLTDENVEDTSELCGDTKDENGSSLGLDRLYGCQEGIGDGFVICGYEDGIKVEYIDELVENKSFSYEECSAEDGSRGADYSPKGWGGLITPSQPPRSDDGMEGSKETVLGEETKEDGEDTDQGPEEKKID